MNQIVKNTKRDVINRPGEYQYYHQIARLLLKKTNQWIHRGRSFPDLDSSGIGQIEIPSDLQTTRTFNAVKAMVIASDRSCTVVKYETGIQMLVILLMMVFLLKNAKSDM